MNDEIQIISDGDGMAVLGEPSAIERFLDSHDLESKKLDLPSFWSTIGAGAALAQAGAAVAANGGRWVQLTQESAELLQRFQPVVNSTSGLLIGVVRGSDGRFQKMLEFAAPGAAAGLMSPAAVAAIGALIAQTAMLKKMEEIEDYLAVLDQKIDEVLRAHKDAVLADVIGVDLVIEEAMTIRAQVGRVSEITWSKVQATSILIGRTQGYALRQLDALADGLERITDVDALAKVAPRTEAQAQEWIAVLAHCFRLQDAIAVLELDRVLNVTPGDVDQHRRGLKIARQNRLELIARSTAKLVARMSASAGRANKWVLLNSINSPVVVRSSNAVTAKVVGLHQLLGIDDGDQSVDARRWLHAVGDLKDKVVETGAGGVDMGRRLGSGAFDRARSATNKVASGVAERTQSRKVDRAEDEL